MRSVPENTSLPMLLRDPVRFARIYPLALLVLLSGAAADAFTTYRNLALYGLDVEVHLPQRLISMVIGPAIGVPLAKLIQLAFVIVVASWWRPWCAPLMIACGLLYALAAMSNYFLWL